MGMEEILDQWPLVALVLAVGSFLQGSVGFAYGLFSVPVLMWLGWTVPQAQGAIYIGTCVQNIWGLWRFRDSVTLSEMVTPGLLRLLALPLGIACLMWLYRLEPDTVRQAVGAVLLAIVLVLAIWRPVPRDRLPAGWGWVAFTMSGFLQGLVGMGGPAMVLWVQAHGWSTQRSRAFLYAQYMVTLPVMLIVLVAAFGQPVVDACVVTLIMLPVIFAATAAGLGVGTRLGRRWLRITTLLLLATLAVSNLVSPWL